MRGAARCCRPSSSRAPIPRFPDIPRDSRGCRPSSSTAPPRRRRRGGAPPVAIRLVIRLVRSRPPHTLEGVGGSKGLLARLHSQTGMSSRQATPPTAHSKSECDARRTAHGGWSTRACRGLVASLARLPSSTDDSRAPGVTADRPPSRQIAPCLSVSPDLAMTSRCPCSAARTTPLTPSWLRASGSAPASSSKLTISAWPKAREGKVHFSTHTQGGGARGEQGGAGGEQGGAGGSTAPRRDAHMSAVFPPCAERVATLAPARSSTYTAKDMLLQSCRESGSSSAQKKRKKTTEPGAPPPRRGAPASRPTSAPSTPPRHRLPAWRVVSSLARARTRCRPRIRLPGTQR